MGPSLTVYVLDQSTEERLTSFDVRLNPIGIPGEFRSTLNEDGGFSFSDPPAGKYSLAVYDPGNRYAPLFQSVTLNTPQHHLLSVRVTPGAILSGQILDEHGRPPRRCYITLLTPGEQSGKTGYIGRWGDRDVTADGHFFSPPLHPGPYILRVAGWLQKPPADTAPDTPSAFQQRCFDFLYPNSRTLESATRFDLSLGETRSGLQIQIPHPTWHTVRGKVIGNLPFNDTHLSVMFAWDPGAVGPVGGSGGPRLQPDGTFETLLQPGRYIVEVCEFSPPEPSGRIHWRRSFARTVIHVPDHDLNGIEIFASVE